MIINVEPSDVMVFVNIGFFVGNIALLLVILKLWLSTVKDLIASNFSLTEQVGVLLASVDSANQQWVVDCAVEKATGDKPIE